MSPSPTRSADTRQRLLEAAGEVFAEVGFRSATIQAICRRAGANIAAVHYHFTDKEQLYRAVVDYADRRAMNNPPPESEADANAEARLRALVTWFLGRLLSEGQPAWFGKLMAREMIEPTAALDAMVRDRVGATHERFSAAVRALVGPAAPRDLVQRCVHSIIGQCVYYRHSRPLLERLFPKLSLGAAEVAGLAAHITAFSIAGARAVAAGGESGARRPRAAG